MSEPFKMGNGIRQGSCLSPKLFSVYVDQLNHDLRDSGVGCHVAGVCVNNISYADDLVLISPNARSMNQLLEICHKFALQHFITYSHEKTVGMVIKPSRMSNFTPPKLYLGTAEIKYVENFKYLGHVLSRDLSDDSDIKRETRNLYIRGNTLIRKFHFVSVAVKCALFKAYCYPLYTCSLWAKFRLSSINKLRVAYNNMLRKLIGVPQWHSARTLFVNLGVRSFYENVRITSYSLVRRLFACNNSIVQTMLHSDCFVHSAIRSSWSNNLFTGGENGALYGLFSFL